MAESNMARLTSLWEKKNKAGANFSGKVFFLIIVCLSIMLSNVYAGSIKEEYELQERCAKSAAEAFRKWYESETPLRHYTNHYNKKLNKCFILVIETTLPKDKKDSPSISKLLIDVNEQKEYGSFFMFTRNKEIMDCKVLGKPYSSESEWDALVKPYMEE